MQGWIKLFRQLLDNSIMLNPVLLQLFIYCLLKANHKDNKFIWNGEDILIKRGSFITGRKQIAQDLKQNENTIYKRLQHLHKLGYVSLESNNKFTILTVEKYKAYQKEDLSNEQQNNNKLTTQEQQINTNNNDKNEKNREREHHTNATFFNLTPKDFYEEMAKDSKYYYFDWKRYFEKIKNYAADKGATSFDWTAKAKNWMLEDKEPFRLTPEKNFALINRKYEPPSHLPD